MLPELQRLILDGIVEILSLYTDFTAGCLRCEISRPDKAELILENGKFLIGSLLPLLETKVQVCYEVINQIVKTAFLLKFSF